MYIGVVCWLKQLAKGSVIGELTRIQHHTMTLLPTLGYARRFETSSWHAVKALTTGYSCVTGAY